MVDLVERSRCHPAVELGCSPRAGIALVKASRARALMHGRHYAVPEDLFALAEDVMLHRMRLRYEAIADGYIWRVIVRLVASYSKWETQGSSGSSATTMLAR